MIRIIIFVAVLLHSQQALTQNANGNILRPTLDSIQWISVTTDSGIVHAAVAIPEGKGPFPTIIILHGTHGFAQEYVQLANEFAKNGFVGVAACWFAGRKGAGERFITPIEFKDAPPLIDVPGTARFRIARHSIDSLVRKVSTLSYVQENHLGLMGHSRGAGAALDFLLTHPGKVHAVILNSAGYPDEVTKRAPEVNIPILIMHGTADNPEDGGSSFTNIERARQFEAALRIARKDVEVKYYDGRGHNALFSNREQFADAVRIVSDFMHRKFTR